MAKKILVIGSSNTDMILQLPTIPRPGETISGGTFTQAAGGKGANQAVAVARAGGQAIFLTKVGEDEFGAKAIADFQKDDIDVSFIKKTDTAPSGLAFIFVDAKGENSIGLAGGANEAFLPEDLSTCVPAFEESGLVLLQLEIPMITVEKAVSMAKKDQKLVVLNPAPAKELSDDLLAQIDILTPNETEAEALTGISVVDEESAKKAANTLLQKGVKTVIITMGKNGVFIFEKGTSVHVPAFKVDAVDTTAAGDTFNGAMVVALNEGKSLQEAVRFGQAAAALSVTKLGAQPSVPHRSEITSFL
jgi:ribokinase